MGIEAMIHIQAKRGSEHKLDFELPTGFFVFPLLEIGKYGETHQVDHLDRVFYYFAEGYERGPWPDLCAVLLTIISSADVEKVWYGSELSPMQPCPPSRVLALSKHFMKHGNRPYYSPNST